MTETFKTYGEVVDFLLAHPHGKAKTSYADRVYDYDDALASLGADRVVKMGLGEIYARRWLKLEGDDLQRWLNKVGRAKEATDQNR